MTLAAVRMPATNLLDSIASAASASSSTAGRTDRASSAGGGSFAELVSKSLAQVDRAQSGAESLAHQYQLGQNDVSIEDAMIAAQKANITFQTTVQVRNKLVAAYNDIMNMSL